LQKYRFPVARACARYLVRKLPDRRGGGCPVFLELSKNMIDRDELLARALAIVFGVEKVAGFDQLGREREHGGGHASARGGQGERDLGVKFGFVEFDLPI
jgi:hypothetical protein